jgi:hypothetical protein
MDSTIKVRMETDREKAMRLGSAIRTARIQFGLSLVTVSRSVGIISVSHVSRLERGQLPLDETEILFCPVMIAITGR